MAFWTSSKLGNFLPLLKFFTIFEPVWWVRHYLPSQFNNFLQCLSCTVRSCIVVLENEAVSVDNRQIFFDWRLVQSIQLFIIRVCINSLPRFQHLVAINLETPPFRGLGYHIGIIFCFFWSNNPKTVVYCIVEATGCMWCIGLLRSGRTDYGGTRHLLSFPIFCKCS